jgi:hypothetical protein
MFLLIGLKRPDLNDCLFEMRQSLDLSAGSLLCLRNDHPARAKQSRENLTIRALGSMTAIKIAASRNDFDTDLGPDLKLSRAQP